MIPSWIVYLGFCQVFVLGGMTLLDTWKWRWRLLIAGEALVIFFTLPMIPGLVRFG